jgi:hypothetical protein
MNFTPYVFAPLLASISSLPVFKISSVPSTVVLDARAVVNRNSLIVCDESGQTKFPFSFAILSWGELECAVADLS